MSKLTHVDRSAAFREEPRHHHPALSVSLRPWPLKNQWVRHCLHSGWPADTPPKLTNSCSVLQMRALYDTQHSCASSLHTALTSRRRPDWYHLSGKDLGEWRWFNIDHWLNISTGEREREKSLSQSICQERSGFLGKSVSDMEGKDLVFCAVSSVTVHLPCALIVPN